MLKYCQFWLVEERDMITTVLTASFALRLDPIASNSSINTIAGAFFLADPNNSRMRLAPTPYYVSLISIEHLSPLVQLNLQQTFHQIEIH
jgi:hypothetical protein